VETRQMGTLTAALLVWEIGARMIGYPVLVPPSLVVPHLVGVGLSHIWASMQVVLLGFALAGTTGTAAGILSVRYHLAHDLVVPVADAMRNVSALALFPPLIIFLGLGLWSKGFVILWAAWPAVLLSTIFGLTAVDRDVVDAAQLDGAGPWIVLWHITLPLSMGVVLTGLRIGMGAGWVALVAAEMLGASRGLGWLVLSYAHTFQFPEMYAAIVVIAAIGFCMNTALLWLQGTIERRLYDA